MENKTSMIIGILVFFITLGLTLYIIINLNPSQGFGIIDDPSEVIDTEPEPSYIIDEDTVYIDDDKVFISANPHTLTDSGYVTYELKSKVYTGDIDFVVGVNSTEYKPKRLQRYNPRYYNETITYVCDGDNKYFNYTLNPKHFWCYQNNNGTWELQFEHDFEGGSLAEKTAYWYEEKYSEWDTINNEVFDIINHDYDGKDRWYAKTNIPIIANQSYKFRIYYEISRGEGFSPIKLYSKYDIAFKRSQDTIQEAIQNDRFYLLDPWIDSTFSNVNKNYLDVGLVSIWNMDEASGNLTDMISGINTTIVSGNPIYQNSSVLALNYSIHFDGTDDYYKTADDDRLDFGTGDFTVCTWVKFDITGATDRFMGKDAHSGLTQGWALQKDTSNKIQFFTRQSGGNSKYCTGTDNANIGSWIFVCGVRASGVLRVYYQTDVSGNIKNQVNCTEDGATNVNTAVGIKLGAMDELPSTSEHQGSLDQAMIWNRSLNHTEINDLYNDGEGIIYSTNVNPSPTVTLIYPTNDTIINSTNIIYFAGNFTDDSLIDNSTLFIYNLDGTLNTTSFADHNDTDIIRNSSVTLVNGLYRWNYQATDDEGDSSFADNNFTLNVSKSPELSVTLNTPVDHANLTNPITFNCSSTILAGTGLLNLSLFIDSVINHTIYNTTAIQNLSISIDLNIEDGSHDYHCEAYNLIGTQGLSDTYDFTVDDTSPVITVTSPLGSQGLFEADDTLFFNWTVTDTHLDTCQYQFNGSNHSIDCHGNNTLIIPRSYSDDTIILTVSDTFGNIATNVTTWIYDLFVNSETYNGLTFENSLESFSINTTYDSSYTSLDASLYYDGVFYPTTKTTTGNTINFNVSIQIPTTATATSKSFNWNLSLDGAEYNTTSKTQTVNPLTAVIFTTNVCGAGYSSVLYYDFDVETNNTPLLVDIEYNFKTGFTNYTSSSNYGTFTEADNMTICINNTYQDLYIGYGEVKYSSTGFVPRTHYQYYGTSLNNDTQLNYTLYELLDADSTSFKLEVEDNNLIPLTNKYTRLLRWYPGLNEYRTVEMGLTDENGDTVIKVEAEDVDYRVGVYEQNGSLIKLADPSRFLCLVNPCTYTLKVDEVQDDYTSILNVDYTLTYTNATGLWSFVYSDSSGLTSSMTMNVYKITPMSKNLICTSSVTGVSGAISCNTSLYLSGTYKAEVVRTASPEVIIASKIINLDISPFKSSFGLFLILIIMIPVVFIFAYMSPVLAIIGGIIALVPAMMLGSISVVVFSCFIVLAGVVLQVLKRVN